MSDQSSPGSLNQESQGSNGHKNKDKKRSNHVSNLSSKVGDLLEKEVN